MIDELGVRLVQLASITAGAIILSEYVPMPIGKVTAEGGYRRRYNALIYCTAMSLAGWGAGLVKMPGALWQQSLGVVLLSLISVAMAFAAVAAKKGLWDKKGKLPK